MAADHVVVSWMAQPEHHTKRTRTQQPVALDWLHV